MCIKILKSTVFDFVCYAETETLLKARGKPKDRITVRIIKAGRLEINFYWKTHYLWYVASLKIRR